MALNTDLWKKKTEESLKGWKKRFDKAGANSIYYFLAAVSFAPIIQAAHSGDWGALSVLGMTLGGAVGTNLLANMAHSLKGKSEEEIAVALVEGMESEPELKLALDALLEKLETLAAAENALSAEDKHWFAETIQRELEELGNGAKIGERAVSIGGDAKDNIVVTGDNNRVVTTESYVENQVIHQAPDPDKEKALREDETRTNYLESLYRRCQSLPLVALGDDPNAREDVRLDDVYIALHTTERMDVEDGKEKEEKFRMPGDDGKKALPALTAFLQTEKMVLLGDPGSGKSTFVRNLLGLQAQILLGKREAFSEVDADLLPVLLTLRDLIGELSELDCKKESAERRDAQLVQAVDHQIEADLKDLYHIPEFKRGLRTALRKGRILLVFDGLDEVPEHLREKVRLAVSAYQKTYALPRMIVTCRVRSYRGSAEQPGFKAFTLAPFTREQAGKFCQGWYDTQLRLGKIDAEFAKKQAEDLARAAWRDELQKLAENPMLLTTMAIIHQKETRLPDQRVKLYRQAVRVLTKRWQEHRFGETLAVSEKLAKILKDEKQMRKILERLAYEAHRVGKKKGKKITADLLRKDAIEILEKPAYLGDTGLANELLDYVDLRSGLLVGRGSEPGKPSVYSFAHRTFQEYLAGCYLVNQRYADRQLLTHAEEAEYWSLAIEFGAEELYYNGRTESQNDVLDLAYTLLSENYKEEKYSRTALWSAKMAALVGAEAIKTDPSPHGGEDYFKRIIPATLWLLESDLTPAERADAGRALAKLGDPRPSVTDVDALELGLVPAGEFWMGSEEGRSDEKPRHKLELPAFWMSRYPISNAQFQQFVDDGGYAKPNFWQEAQKAEVWAEGKVKGWGDDEPREVPANFGEPFNLPNHPVVGITWYEMLAFTRWLDLRWRKTGILPKNWQVTLPSEAEWEKSARGGIHIPKEAIIMEAKVARWDWGSKKQIRNPQPQRVYPWENEFDANKVNNGDAGIGTTSAVGCFPSGASPYGLEDMSGNVWEWTRSLKGDYPYPEREENLAERENIKADNNPLRVLRGGAFYNNRNYVRCAFRNSHSPNYGNYDFGFRVVVVSPSSSY